jgi:hypothetical protein
MAVTDYRKMSRMWQAERNEQDAQKLIKMQEKAKEEGKPIPMHFTRRGNRVSPESLPVWPVWAEHHVMDEKESEADESKKVSRTKKVLQ